MSKLRIGKLKKVWKYRGLFHARVSITHGQIGFCTHQTFQVSMAELPPSLAYLRAKKHKKPVLVWCDTSQTQEHTEDQRDGIETFTVTTHLSGEISLLGFYTGILVSASRRSMGHVLRMSSSNRSDGLINRRKYNIRFNLRDLSRKYSHLQPIDGEGTPLDDFDLRVLAQLQKSSDYILKPNYGGWTREHIELRELNCHWVNPLIKYAPQDEFVPPEWLPNIQP